MNFLHRNNKYGSSRNTHKIILTAISQILPGYLFHIKNLTRCHLKTRLFYGQDSQPICTTHKASNRPYKRKISTLCKKAVPSAVEQLLQLLSVQGTFQMQVIQHLRQQGWWTVSDASLSAPANTADIGNLQILALARE